MKPIRILHVLGALDRGGAETMVMNLYRNIDRTRVQFDFVIHTEKKCDYSDEVEMLGGRIYSAPRYNGINTFDYVGYWKTFFAEHAEYKIIHGHMRSTASIYLSIAKKYGCYTIAHSHNVSSGKGFSARVKDIYQLPLRYVAEDFFACSKNAGQWLFGKRIVQSPKFKVLPNAIDAELFRYNEEIRNRKRNELALQGKVVYGHIGRFHPQKNHAFLVKVFEKIYRKNSDALLLLIGEGSLESDIKTFVKGKGIENAVIFLGMREDVNELLQAMDVFLFPSLYEGLGIAIIEAEAAGLPILCSNAVPRDVALTELIHFLPIDDEDKWVEELEKIDTHKRCDMFEEIKNCGYDIHGVAKELQEYYLKI